MHHQTDEKLYLEVINSNGESKTAFHAIYKRYSSSLFRFIYRFTVNAQIAEEILQDIFIELLSGKFKLESESNLKSWLYTLAKNKSLNHLKKSSFEKNNPLVLENAISDENIETSFIENNLFQKLSLVTKSLPVDLSDTWQLRKNGFDYQQIVNQLSIPVGTVKSRFSRIVEHLKKEFEK